MRSISFVDNLVDLAGGLRPRLPFPRGVYRFRSFEEADSWKDHTCSRRRGECPASAAPKRSEPLVGDEILVDLIKSSWGVAEDRAGAIGLRFVTGWHWTALTCGG